MHDEDDAQGVMGRRETKKVKIVRVCVCVCLLGGGGAAQGIIFPPPWPQPEALGGPLVPEEKHLRPPPITPEPSAGLFTLAWLPDSFTDVTYRHTGTLSQRG